MKLIAIHAGRYSRGLSFWLHSVSGEDIKTIDDYLKNKSYEYGDIEPQFVHKNLHKVWKLMKTADSRAFSITPDYFIKGYREQITKDRWAERSIEIEVYKNLGVAKAVHYNLHKERFNNTKPSYVFAYLKHDIAGFNLLEMLVKDKGLTLPEDVITNTSDSEKAAELMKRLRLNYQERRVCPLLPRF